LQRPPRTPLIAAAFAAVLVNIGHGRNGFLTAAMRDGAPASASGPVGADALASVI
jgi:hypothetical protein